MAGVAYRNMMLNNLIVLGEPEIERTAFPTAFSLVCAVNGNALKDFQPGQPAYALSSSAFLQSRIGGAEGFEIDVREPDTVVFHVESDDTPIRLIALPEHAYIDAPFCGSIFVVKVGD